MFDGPDYPTSLNEDLFDSWLEQGRSSKMGYNYLLIVWDTYDAKYQPVYVEDRDKIVESGRESLIAVYDLYSESRISLQD